MEYVSGLRCINCHRTWPPAAESSLCPGCGGLLDVEYDYSLLARRWSPNQLVASRQRGMWRYLPLLPVDPAAPRPPLAVGGTPLYALLRLAEAVGLNKPLLLKDDGLNPTGSLKDRASAVAVAKAREAGAQTIACASTGNAASSLAGNAAATRLDSVIFVPARAPQGKVAQLIVYGATVISVQGSYAQAFRLSQQAIERWGWYNRNAAINPYLMEGKKTVVLELAEQLDWKLPHWLAVSVGDGCTLAAAGKALVDLHRLGWIDTLPRLIGVQAAGCNPICRAWNEGKPVQACQEDTLADSIAVGQPRNPDKALAAIRQTRGQMVAVTDDEIFKAMGLLGRAAGVFVEPAAAAALAGLMRLANQGVVAADEQVGVIITGNGLKDPGAAERAAGAIHTIVPDIEQVATIIEGGQKL